MEERATTVCAFTTGKTRQLFKGAGNWKAGRCSGQLHITHPRGFSMRTAERVGRGGQQANVHSCPVDLLLWQMLLKLMRRVW